MFLDTVPTFKRLQYKEQRTVWTDVVIGQTPVFAHDSKVMLHAPPNEKLAQDDSFKFMLSFDHDKFLTPWILISDAKTRLVMCRITFKHDGPTINSMTVSTVYDHAATQQEEVDDKILLVYHWVEEQEHDTRSALSSAFVVGCALSILCLFSLAFDPRGVLSSRAILQPKYSSDGHVGGWQLHSDEGTTDIASDDPSPPPSPSPVSPSGGPSFMAAAAAYLPHAAAAFARSPLQALGGGGGGEAKRE